MNLQTSLAKLALLLATGVLVAGCASPQESGVPDADGGDGAGAADEPGELDQVQPTLPAFDANATSDEGAAGDAPTGNETMAG